MTADGAALVKEADRLGMVHDVSHLSRQSVDDLLATARGPVIASHVGADAVFAHKRNLTDAHMRAIAGGGGVVAPVLYRKLLAEVSAWFAASRLATRDVVHLPGDPLTVTVWLGTKEGSA